MDIYEVELCHRGRWEQQDARFVAARNADEAAYKVTGIQLRSEGERRKIRLRVRRLGNGSPPPHAVLCRVMTRPGLSIDFDLVSDLAAGHLKFPMVAAVCRCLVARRIISPSQITHGVIKQRIVLSLGRVTF
jgi:hypothetical protein